MLKYAVAVALDCDQYTKKGQWSIQQCWPPHHLCPEDGYKT